jgi:exo-beta-1,3-glucanase (GH17 family)
MVVLTVRDPAFVRRVVSGVPTDDGPANLDWKALGRELGQGEWSAPLARIATAERNLARELSQSTDAARSVLASTLEQVRAAARLAAQLARRLRSIDQAIGYEGMNPDLARREAADKRARAASASDAEARRALADAASALDTSARTADSLRAGRERTAAQLESLSAVVESIAVRGVRLRVQSDDGTANLAESLGAEMDAVRETLGVFESMDDGSEAKAAGDP